MVIVIVMFYDDYNDQVRNAEPRPPTADPGMDPPLSSLCSPNGVSWFQWLWIWDDDIVINQKTLHQLLFWSQVFFHSQASQVPRLASSFLWRVHVRTNQCQRGGWWLPWQQNIHFCWLEYSVQDDGEHTRGDWNFLPKYPRYITKYWLENSKNVKVLFMSQFKELKTSHCSTKFLLKIQFNE